MPTPEGGMTPAEIDAYNTKRLRERPEHDRLTRRYRRAMLWLESDCNTLTHWRRFVAHTEAILHQFREERDALPPFEGSGFMWELSQEDPVLWAAYRALATPGEARRHP